MSLGHYRDLASNDEEVRLKAAHSLLSELSTGNSEATEYALNRLIRGLASGRESSRIGFSITLTEVGVPTEFRDYHVADQVVVQHSSWLNC